jgi:catechol 2,3-dioxygenase-like lactoylglutathione lyase family enzyme
MAAIRFKHLSISATNLEESLRFYEEMFGLERIPTYNFGFRRQCLRCGAHQLHIFELEDAVPVRQHFRSSEARESRAAEWRGAAGDALSRAPEGPRAGVRDAPGWRRRRWFGLV